MSDDRGRAHERLARQTVAGSRRWRDLNPPTLMASSQNKPIILLGGGRGGGSGLFTHKSGSVRYDA